MVSASSARWSRGVKSVLSGHRSKSAAITLPTLAIAGSNDGSTPPDLVRETAELIKGSKFHLMRGAGHLPMAEKPEEYATILTDFLDQIGHISL